jgi:hypothetical protein
MACEKVSSLHCDSLILEFKGSLISSSFPSKKLYVDTPSTDDRGATNEGLSW